MILPFLAESLPAYWIESDPPAVFGLPPRDPNDNDDEDEDDEDEDEEDEEPPVVREPEPDD